MVASARVSVSLPKTRRKWCLKFFMVASLPCFSVYRSSSEQINVNSLVVVKDPKTPSFLWKFGRVVKVHPGVDGIVRVVSVRTV